MGYCSDVVVISDACSMAGSMTGIDSVFVSDIWLPFKKIKTRLDIIDKK